MFLNRINNRVLLELSFVRAIGESVDEKFTALKASHEAERADLKKSCSHIECSLEFGRTVKIQKLVRRGRIKYGIMILRFQIRKATRR